MCTESPISLVFIRHYVCSFSMFRFHISSTIILEFTGNIVCRRYKLVSIQFHSRIFPNFINIIIIFICLLPQEYGEIQDETHSHVAPSYSREPCLVAVSHVVFDKLLTSFILLDASCAYANISVYTNYYNLRRKFAKKTSPSSARQGANTEDRSPAERVERCGVCYLMNEGG